MNNEDNVRI